ncbi:MAG: hypothetical protein V4559_15505 [Pseudomonadota bacterium]
MRSVLTEEVAVAGAFMRENKKIHIFRIALPLAVARGVIRSNCASLALGAFAS